MVFRVGKGRDIDLTFIELTAVFLALFLSVFPLWPVERGEYFIDLGVIAYRTVIPGLLFSLILAVTNLWGEYRMVRLLYGTLFGWSLLMLIMVLANIPFPGMTAWPTIEPQIGIAILAFVAFGLPLYLASDR
jgi:hypothetical protein